MKLVALLFVLNVVADISSSPLHAYQDDSEENDFDLTKIVPNLEAQIPHHTLSSSLENEEPVRNKRDSFWVWADDSSEDTVVKSIESTETQNTVQKEEEEKDVMDREAFARWRFNSRENDVNQDFSAVADISDPEPGKSSEVSDLNGLTNQQESKEMESDDAEKDITVYDLSSPLDAIKLFSLPWVDLSSAGDEVKDAHQSRESDDLGYFFPIHTSQATYPRRTSAESLESEDNHVADSLTRPDLHTLGIDHSDYLRKLIDEEYGMFPYKFANREIQSPRMISSASMTSPSQQMPAYWGYQTTMAMGQQAPSDITVIVGNMKIQMSSVQPMPLQYPQYYPYAYRMSDMYAS